MEDYTDVTVQMGDLEVVQGLDMALALMKIGEIAEIKVDARFAYGEIGLKNETDKSKEIPPNAKVLYFIMKFDLEYDVQYYFLLRLFIQ